MTQERINKVFQTELGQQLNSIYCAPDDSLFIRYEEAMNHCKQNNLDEKKIQEWFEEFSGSDVEPTIRNEKVDL